MKNAREIAEEIVAYNQDNNSVGGVHNPDEMLTNAIESAIIDARAGAFEEAACLSENMFNKSAHGTEETQHIASCAVADEIRALAEKGIL